MAGPRKGWGRWEAGWRQRVTRGGSDGLWRPTAIPGDGEEQEIRIRKKQSDIVYSSRQRETSNRGGRENRARDLRVCPFPAVTTKNMIKKRFVLETWTKFRAKYLAKAGPALPAQTRAFAEDPGPTPWMPPKKRWAEAARGGFLMIGATVSGQLQASTRNQPPGSRRYFCLPSWRVGVVGAACSACGRPPSAAPTLFSRILLASWSRLSPFPGGLSWLRPHPPRSSGPDAPREGSGARFGTPDRRRCFVDSFFCFCVFTAPQPSTDRDSCGPHAAERN